MLSGLRFTLSYLTKGEEDARFPSIRAGSGNLNNLDKWKFCLNAA
jgi:hypothetical protein